MSEKKVFIVGPGFIGWNILDLLLNNFATQEQESGYKVSALVRRQSHADSLRSSGATPILGDLNDKELITKLTLESDVVFHTATADHLPSVEAVLDGIKQRAEAGKSTIYIHTSGTSLLDDESYNEFKTDVVYRDDDGGEAIDALKDSAPHRDVDLVIVKTKKELGDKAKIAIMIPPLIYGYNPAHERLSIQIPVLTRFALKHGFAGYVGKGLGVESNIHVIDLARAYVVLLHHLEATASSDPDVQNPYYYCETTGDNEPSWRDVASVIGQALHEAGKISDPTPREVPQKLNDDLFGPYTGFVIGLNSRSRANRLRALGWKPIEKDWRSSYLEDELPQLLKE